MWIAPGRRSVQTRSVAPSPRLTFWPAAALLVITLVIYIPSLHGVFVLDDKNWIIESEPFYRDFAGLVTMWVRPSALPQYFPLTGVSFWIDRHLWGLWPLPYHVENVLLHAGAALLLWQLLLKLGIRWAWFGGAVYAWHPMMASSVSWITERKNVLSTCLFLAALLAYGRFTAWWRDHEPGQRASWRSYALAAFLYFAALMAKATTLFFPAVVLLIAWWKRPGLRRRDWCCALPLLAPGVALGCYFVSVEQSPAHAWGPDFDFSMAVRIVLAGRSLLFYLSTFFWPHALSPIYARWPTVDLAWRDAIYPALALGILASAWVLRRHWGRGVAVALFAWAGILSPMLGFVNLAGMRLSFVWDHLAYLPNTALAGLAAGGLGALSQRVGREVVWKALGGVALASLLLLTWRQAGVYQDASSIWRQTLACNPASWAAHYKYGEILEQEGQQQEAIAHYRKALELRPDFPEVSNELGLMLNRQGQYEEAIEQLQRATYLRPYISVYLYNLASVLIERNRASEAVPLLERAVKIAPYDANARTKLIQAKASVQNAH